MSILYMLSLATIVLIGLLVMMLRIKKQCVKETSRVEIFKKLFDVSEDTVFVLSKDYKVRYVNKAFYSLFSSPGEIGKKLTPMPMIKIKKEWIPFDRFIEDQCRHQIEKVRAFPQLRLLIKQYTQSIPVNIYIDRFAENECESEWCYVILVHDLRKEVERSRVLYRHKLTNLPNQLQAKEDLNKLFSKLHLHGKKLALILMDLDNFAQIRALIGYAQAENIVIRFAQFLESFAKENDFYVYHMFNNNFLLCLPVVETESEVQSIIKKIQKELRSLYEVNGVQFYLTASAGVSIYPDSGTTITLLDHAFKALIEAQGMGFGYVNIYKPTEIEEKYDELELFNAVHEAIKKDEFEVYYQPIVNAVDHSVISAEALIRWRYEGREFISPDIFIPMLEKSEFIIDLGRYVLREVLKQQKRWEVFKFKPIKVSINVSLPEIESEGFVEHVAKELKEHQVPPELIRFEITEGVAIKNAEFVNRQLWNLKRLGVSIALDDFGTGYTSFSYLKKFPAEVLKIDKTLIDQILTNKEDQRIVKAMIELGHTIGMKVVVEGVENKSMAEMIASYGCDQLQGYYFSKPKPAYEFQELIRR